MSVKIVIAPDSFKESLSARQAARAIADGFRTVVPDADLIELPAGDGGEGASEALVFARGGRDGRELAPGGGGGSGAGPGRIR